jgi:hypothetical protein
VAHARIAIALDERLGWLSAGALSTHWNALHRRGRPRTRRLPVGRNDRPTRPKGAPSSLNPTPGWGLVTGAKRRRTLEGSMRSRLATLVRGSSTTGHCPAVPTRASQSDSRRCHRTGRQTPATTPTMTSHQQKSQPTLDIGVHLRANVWIVANPIVRDSVPGGRIRSSAAVLPGACIPPDPAVHRCRRGCCACACCSGVRG